MSEVAPDGGTDRSRSDPGGEGSGEGSAAAPTRLGDRRRLIQRAIRHREPAPEGLEDLAMQVALRQAGLRWFVVLYAIGFVVEIASIFVENHTSTRIRDGVVAALFLIFGYQQFRVGQRAKDAVDRWSSPPTP